MAATTTFSPKTAAPAAPITWLQQRNPASGSGTAAVSRPKHTVTSGPKNTDDDCKDGLQVLTTTTPLVKDKPTNPAFDGTINPDFTCTEAGMFLSCSSAAPGCSRGPHTSGARIDDSAPGCSSPTLRQRPSPAPTLCAENGEGDPVETYPEFDDFFNNTEHDRKQPTGNNQISTNQAQSAATADDAMLRDPPPIQSAKMAV